MMHTKHVICLGMMLLLGGTTVSLRASEAETEKTAEPQIELQWHTEYGPALKAAQSSERMLFIHFHNPSDQANLRAFEEQVLADKKIREQLDRFELLRLPTDATIVNEGTTSNLLEHPSFYHMHGRQGVAIVDLQNREEAYYHHVVSSFPFKPGTFYSKRKIDVILNLPPGTLTQRTLIYAVRTHPDTPQSSNGELHPVLEDGAEHHSVHQASINLQGHHNWDSRFHQLNAKLPNDVLPVEVAAESWPGETLVEAAEECVHCWRQSSGHWSAVRAFHPLFGYDMKRGSNGVWYATGIFGKRR